MNDEVRALVRKTLNDARAMIEAMDKWNRL